MSGYLLGFFFFFKAAAVDFKEVVDWRVPGEQEDPPNLSQLRKIQVS